MVFHENCLPADDSHEIAYPFFENMVKDDAIFSGGGAWFAVVIDALRASSLPTSVVC